jgi:hypothetical protein
MHSVQNEKSIYILECYVFLKKLVFHEIVQNQNYVWNMCWYLGLTICCCRCCCCCCCGGSCGCGGGGGGACSIETALTSYLQDRPKKKIPCDCAVIACREIGRSLKSHV